MSGAHASGSSRPFAKAAWLPPHGEGNGLTADSWAPLLDAPAPVTAYLRSALREAGVPAYSAVRSLRPRSRARALPTIQRLWVSSVLLRTAEDVVMRALAAHRQH
jgi:hypothetical protein